MATKPMFVQIFDLLSTLPGLMESNASSAPNWDTKKAETLLNLMEEVNIGLSDDVMIPGDILASDEWIKAEVPLLGFLISRIGSLQVATQMYGGHIRDHLLVLEQGGES